MSGCFIPCATELFQEDSKAVDDSQVKNRYWIARPVSLGTCHSFSWPLLFRQAFQECHNLCSYFKLCRHLSNI